MMATTNIQPLIGITMARVYTSGSMTELHFVSEDGQHYTFYHKQDCCEDVRIEDIDGDLDPEEK